MPERATLERARRDAAEGNAPGTQAGEFVREEMHPKTALRKESGAHTPDARLQITTAVPAHAAPPLNGLNALAARQVY